MLQHFVTACRAARTSTGAGQTTIAALLGLNQSSVARFEAAKGWPRNPDEYAAAYAAAGRTTVEAIWDEAVKLQRAAGPENVPAEMVALEAALTAATGAKKRRSGSRAAS